MSVGQAVTTARVEAGLSVDDVAERTRIRATLIRQIEADNFDGCGGVVYARGHLRSIAAAVGTDPAPLVAEFDRVNRPQVAEAIETARIFETDTAQADRRSPNWAAAMIVALVAISVAAGVSLFSGSGDPATLAGPSARPSASSAAPEATPAAPGAPAATPGATAPDALAQARPEGVTLRITVTGPRSWVRVSDAANTTLFQGQLNQGEVREFANPTELRLIIGDSGAVGLVVNGQDLGAPGASGAVTRVTFGPGDPSAGQGG